MTRLLLLLTVALFATQLVNCDVCVEVGTTGTGPKPTKIFVKCSAIYDEDGKLIGLAGGSGATASCLAMDTCPPGQGGSQEVECPTLARTQVQANPTAACCGCNQISAEGLTLPPACTCHSTCTSTGKGWSSPVEGATCDRCGDGSSNAANGYANGFAPTSVLHVDHAAECAAAPPPPPSKGKGQSLLQAKSKDHAGCIDPSVLPIQQWSCNCAEQLLAVCGTDSTCVAQEMCCDTTHDICSSWQSGPACHDVTCSAGLLQEKTVEQRADDLLSLLANSHKGSSKTGWNCG